MSVVHRIEPRLEHGGGCRESLIVILLGAARGGEEVDEPPNTQAIAGEDLEDAQSNVVEEQSFPAEQNSDDKDQRRVDIVDRCESNNFVVAHFYGSVN